MSQNPAKPASKTPPGKEAQPGATQAPPKPPSTPESEALARVNDLQSHVDQLKQEVRSLQGRLANRDPAQVQQVQKENEHLQLRLKLLRKAYFGLITDAHKWRQMDEAELTHEMLRRAAVDYFKKANIAHEIWKNIES